MLKWSPTLFALARTPANEGQRTSGLLLWFACWRPVFSFRFTIYNFRFDFSRFQRGSDFIPFDLDLFRVHAFLTDKLRESATYTSRNQSTVSPRGTQLKNPLLHTSWAGQGKKSLVGPALSYAVLFRFFFGWKNDTCFLEVFQRDLFSTAPFFFFIFFPWTRHAFSKARLLLLATTDEKKIEKKIKRSSNQYLWYATRKYLSTFQFKIR